MREFWRHRTKFEKALVIALFVISLGCAAGIREANTAAQDAEEAVAETQRIAKVNSALISQIKRESRERVHQSCLQSEREHKNDVRQLVQTYEYLNDVKGDEKNDKIVQFAVRNIEETEDKARKDVAPDFCDDPGVGYPEPDPVLPQKKDFSYLLVK